MLLNQKLEYWKNRLLDLGKRNRLINCTLPKSVNRVYRTSLLIYNPTYDDLWEMLSDSESVLEFPIPTDDFDEEEQESLFQTDAFSNGIKTSQTPV